MRLRPPKHAASSSVIRSRPRSIGRTRPSGLERCAHTSIAASRLAAYRAVQSQPILTRAASRHRMAANGFRCRFVAFGIVSAYDRRGVVAGRESFSAGPGAPPPDVQMTGGKLDLVPLQVADLRGA